MCLCIGEEGFVVRIFKCLHSIADHAIDRITHLRSFLETSPLQCNNSSSLNPGGKRTYIILCTHCHYGNDPLPPNPFNHHRLTSPRDHLGGIMQFLRGGQTDIVASAAGRDFITSNLAHHGLFDSVGVPAPYFQVTHWAQAFERLQWPFPSPDRTVAATSKPVDLGITILQTPGHTPDELAWYDHAEKHLYVGDSFYEEGEDGMPVLWPAQGNLIEWYFSMLKLQGFVRSENARPADNVDDEDGEETWVTVHQRVKIGCGHQTASVDGEEILERLLAFWWRVVKGDVPVARTSTWHGEVTDWWRESDGKSKISFKAPRRLMEEARHFFIIP